MAARIKGTSMLQASIGRKEGIIAAKCLSGMYVTTVKAMLNVLSRICVAVDIAKVEFAV